MLRAERIQSGLKLIVELTTTVVSVALVDAENEETTGWSESRSFATEHHASSAFLSVVALLANSPTTDALDTISDRLLDTISNATGLIH